jgi:hypothetical protein
MVSREEDSQRVGGTTRSSDELTATIRRLEARVARLEKSLAERSKFLRHLTRELCEEDLVTVSRVSCGLPPLPRAGFGLRGWRETTALSSGDVDRTMEEVWRSVTPPGEDPDEPDERGRTLRA